MESIIFNTLLHSLWQGVILAVLTALIVLLTTRSDAKVRYNLFVGCLMLFILGVGATFIFEWNKFNPASAVTAVHTVGLGDTLNLKPGNAVNTGLLDNWMGYVSNYSSSIVLIWLLMIAAKSIRFMVDISTLFRIRRAKVYDAGAFLENKVKYLAEQYGIKQTIRIVQSGLIQVPMVLGHLKPLILVPLGLVNGLSAAEVDAIICHELAHIRRRDYLVNLFQSIAEILFFFNPAVLWLSNMIRTEREHCCDDLAVSAARTKTDYIKALISCQEFANEVPAYAMAVNGGGKKHLVNRVQRLISSRNQSLNKIEKAIVGFVMLSAVILTTAFSGNGPVKEVKRAVAVISKKIAERNAGDEVYAQLIREKLVSAGQNVTFILDKDKFIVNDVKQPEAIHEQYVRNYLKDPKKTIHFVLNSDDKHASVSIRDTQHNEEWPEAPKAPKMPKAPKSPKEVPGFPAVPPAPKVPSGVTAPPKVPVPPVARVAGGAPVAPVAKVALAPAAPKAPVPPKAPSTADDLTNDLVSKGLIKDKKNFSYTLNSDELIIDGVTQPEAIQKRYRKYLKHQGQTISSTVQTD